MSGLRGWPEAAYLELAAEPALLALGGSDQLVRSPSQFGDVLLSSAEQSTNTGYAFQLRKRVYLYLTSDWSNPNQASAP